MEVCSRGKIAIGILSVALLKSVGAAASCGDPIGKFVSLDGNIEVERAEQEAWQPAGLDLPLCPNDTIHVGENSRAAVQLINEVTLRLDQNTTIRLVDVARQPEKRSLLDLVIGAFKSFSRPPRTLAVNTPYLNGLIEGTEFAMRVEGDATLVTVYEGKVKTVNDKGRLSLTRGESALARAGTAPQPYVLVKPRDAVQWTLYFPPVLAALAGGTRQMPADASPPVTNALHLATRGDTPGALALLEAVPAPNRDAAFHQYRAALFLDVGRVAEALTDIEAALAKDPKAGFAYALRAIIEVVRNERSQALADAERAVAAGPSGAAKIALSYAQQAEFRVEAARETLSGAAEEYPDDPLVQARLAELWLMVGEREKALAVARKAEALAPHLERSQAVLGFTALAALRTKVAISAFQRAIALDSADPLAHLGLGLSKIKDGHLAEGRQELEVAIALDSSNALLRAYLGKAYYEEKRTPLDEQQYGIAQELDPADPTAYLYDAIEKQTTNRPVEALHDLEKSIELNDNRAVYRSRLLLDSDLAARSASLGRVYTDLGFQQLALREGWKSLNADPSNFSAHRFLADSYAVLPRHEVARVSELLQSQLLQPLNMTPIQPRLGVSNLFLISAGGPGALSFNEFNPIFNRDGLTFQTSGMVGGNSTYAGEGVLAGIYKNTAFSVGGFHFTTDGFRPNADQRDDMANAFLQLELSPETSIQAEYRYRNFETGDIRLKFFPESIFPTQRFATEKNSVRFGGRHSFSPNSILLGNFTYQDSEFRETHDPFPQPGVLFVDFDQPKQNALGGEIQHLFRSSYINITSGGGYFDTNDAVDQLVRFGSPFIPGPPDTPPTIDVTGFTDLDLRHGNAYTYSYINLIKNLTVTLGGSFDHADSEFLHQVKDQLNPKFGLTWTPLPGITVRGAAFRTLKRTLITQQTLEPTQVAGFNQFYDDFDLTQAWRYGGAIDQKFSSSVYGGVELSRRDLKVPYLDFTVDAQVPPTVNSDWQENLARAYMFWTPHEWLALRAEYVFEKVKRQENFSQGATDANTHRVPVGINFFHPSGLGASVTATYFNQNGTFGGFYTTDPIRQGSDNFWLLDMALNYRLPKRYGFITVGATNILDQDFRYFDSDLNNASIQPVRMVFGRVTLALP